MRRPHFAEEAERMLLRKELDTSPAYPMDPDEYYRVMTNRNFHFVTPRGQKAIRNMKILVAGCGSGGGACIEPLARLGVTHLRFADTGFYELTNYNRQRAYLRQLYRSKAEIQLESVREVNPFIDAHAYSNGINEDNVVNLVEWADLIFDCVDVTGTDALRMKLRLHEVAHKSAKMVLVPLDVGYCQTGIGFDYRQPGSKPLGGRLQAARAARTPLTALFSFFPLSRVPGHSLQLVEDALRKKPLPVSQLGCASDLLSSVATAAVIRLAQTGQLVPSWHFDMDQLALSPWDRFRLRLTAPLKRRKIRRLMRTEG